MSTQASRMHGGVVPRCIHACSRIVSRCLEAVVNVPACQQLAEYVRSLSVILADIQRVEDISGLHPDAQRLFRKLEHQMQNIRKLITQSCVVPGMYRIVNGFQMCSDFQFASQAIGSTLKDLHSVVLPDVGEVGGGLRQLGVSLSSMSFPMRPREREIYDESQIIADRVYGSEISIMEGVELLRSILDRLLGRENIETDWKHVAKHLFYDMNVANVNSDMMQAHRTRLLLWAMAGPKCPPPEFYCPITMEIMEQPVVLVETSITYDKKSVDVWLSPHGPQKCPVTRKKLSSAGYVHNKSLKMLIEDWKRENGFELEYHRGKSSPVHAPVGDHEGSVRGDESDSEDIDDYPTEDSIERSPEASSNVLEPPDAMGQAYRQDDQYPHNQPVSGTFMSPALTLPPLSIPNHAEKYYFPDSDSKMRMPAYGSSPGSLKQSQQGSEERCPVSPQSAVQYSEHSERGHGFEQMFSPMSQRTSHSGGGRKAHDRRAVKEMLEAAEHGDMEFLMEMADEGRRLDEANEDGETPLHAAVASGHLKLVEFLLSRGASINSRLHSTGVTALYLAACNGHSAVCGLLLAHDANIMITNKSGWSPLHAAIDTGHTPVVGLLLEYAQRERHVMYPTLATEAGWTSLHYGVRKGDIEAIEMLLPFFPHINHKCNAGFTPLHVAVDTGSLEVTQLLLKANPDPNAQSNDGWTVLHAAQDSNNIEIGRLLLHAGADPDKAGQDGITPLHRAAFQNHLEFAKLLIEEGEADLHKKTQPADGYGRKASDIASDMSHIELHAYLFKRRVKTIIGRPKGKPAKPEGL